MMDSLLLQVMTSNTAAFIDVNPVTVALTPRSKVSDGKGGFRLVDLPPRLPQRFTLIPQSMSVRPIAPITTTDGKVMTMDYVIVGVPDLEVAVDDWWMQDGDKVRVAYVFPANGYEVRAGVVRMHAGS